ncbi:MAG TPA: nuclear transport factor 2 family protein [Dyella sp.]|uniref:YybH family protein n=1 Tax=Dyella sp. TaxID=1869338 RepID=UPI002CB89506|nr:nuclear transport factor 2 family protein [Dyella sp.]HUB89082.1 nuclear transport factor 2 family protein [Dyella sp.]
MSNSHPAVIDGQLAGIEPNRPLAALNAFYRAFNQRDLPAMEQHWWNDEAAAMSNPLGGIARGWPAIRAVYARIFGGSALVQVEFHDYTLHEAGDMFYAVGRERGTLVRGDTRLPLAIRTTRLFRRIDGGWKQVHHHGSFEDPALLAAYREAVR